MNKYMIVLLCWLVLGACTNKYDPVDAFELECDGQKYDVLVFKDSIAMNGGAGFTTKMDRVQSDIGEKYEWSHSAFWHKKGIWYFYDNEISNGELKMKDNPYTCELIRQYTHYDAIKMIRDTPCSFGDKCN